MPTLIYLGGDAYPSEADCEKRLAWVLATSNSFGFISQGSLLTDKDLMIGNWRCISHRLNQLETLVNKIDDDVVLIGRSSGARVATLFACNYKVSAVVCLGYPFESPVQGPDKDRFSHLADIKVPTLIVQGIRDNYGGLEVVDRYEFSNSVELYFIDAEHEFDLPSTVLDEVIKKAGLFISANC
jgi:predicted alpha/beta-hydrolase family hydrolase